MKSFNRFSILIAFTILSCCLHGQSTPVPVDLRSSANAAQIKPGVAVEKIAKDSSAEQAGLKEADMIISWTRGEAHGAIDSPFDLNLADAEQGPRGDVTLVGLRGTDAHSWILGPGEWGIGGRPDFPVALLQEYNEGQGLIDTAKFEQADTAWAKFAKEIESSTIPATSSWIAFRAAELFSQKREWAKADKFYALAIQRAPSSVSYAKALLLKSWGFSYSARPDWANGEKYCRLALEEARESGEESLATASYLVFTGRLLLSKGELRNAQTLLNQALAIQQKLAPDSMPVGETLSRLGVAAKQLGELNQAQDLLKKALVIQQKLAPDTFPVARTLTELGGLISDTGDIDQAEKYFQHAIEIQRKVAPDSRELAASLQGWGIAASNQGNLAEAMQHYQEALAILEKIDSNGWQRAVTISFIGQVDSVRNDLVAAEQNFSRAAEILKKTNPETIYYTYALLGLGIVQDLNGDSAKAERTLREMLAIQLKIAPNHFFVADAYNHLGAIRRATGDLLQAEEYFLKALKIEQQLVPLSSRTGQALLSLCYLHIENGALDKAKTYCRQSLDIYEQLSPGSRQSADTLACLADIEVRQNHREKAAQLYEQALNDLEKQMDNLGGSEQTRSRFRSLYKDPYFQYIDLLVKDHQIGKALDVLERSRARSLLETLSDAKVDVDKDADPRLLEQKRSLLAEINTNSEARVRLLNKEQSEVELRDLDKKMNDLNDKYGDTVEKLRTASPGYSALMQSQLLASRQIQESLLDQNTVLLEYALGEERSYVFTVGHDSLRVIELPSRTTIERAARQVYQVLNSAVADTKTSLTTEHKSPRTEKENYTAAADELSRMVLAPIASQIKNKRLLIVADGALQYVPFAALPDPAFSSGTTSSPLVINHEIIGLPSASSLAALRRQATGRTRPLLQVAVFADPVFDKDDARITGQDISIQSATRGIQEEKSPQTVDYSTLESSDLISRSAVDVGLNRNGQGLPRLLFSRKEAEAILSVTPKGQVKELLDFNANRTAATDPSLGQYRVIHFATHGLLNSEHPELSGLVLSMVDKHGSPQNGFLQLHDIYNLHLPADLVVLSACETALGKDISGEGMIGITRGFMYAGANRVVASLWKVSDVATAELMAEFYRAMEKDGLPAAAALRAAQIKMLKQARWHNPYYWAAFQIQGEWN